MAYTISWDEVGQKYYETGVRHGVLYKMVTSGTDAGNYGTGVPWNGLTSVSETPSGAEETALYADDQKYLSLYSAEELGGTIEAYTYPDEWAECDGSAEIAAGVMIGQQPRVGFGMCYRTVLGNDLLNENYSYKLHLLYNAKASPSEKSYETINDSPSAITFSWEYKTTPVPIPDTDYKPTALIVIDASKADPTKLAALEAILYGDGTTDPSLPSPARVMEIMGTVAPTGATGTTGASGSTGETDPDNGGGTSQP